MNKSSIKKRILVADDNPAILDALQIMLEDEGYEVETTMDGATAQIMRKHLPDLLLLDIWMPGVDGRDVCKLFKSDPETSHIPVIMVSAAKDTAQIAKDSGADDFISKPFCREDLLAIVEKHINKYHSHTKAK